MSNQLVARSFSSLLGHIALPPLLLRSLFSGRWRRALPDRLTLSRLPFYGEVAQQCIWLHGASLGEVAGLKPIVELLYRDYPWMRVVVTTTSETGKQEVEKWEFEQEVYNLPFDHPWLMRRAFNRFNPFALVVAETELWPNLFFTAAKRGVRVVIVNGRISDRTFPRYRALKGFVSAMLKKVEKIFVQSSIDYDRFIALGVEPSRVQLSGSTKLARDLPVAPIEDERRALFSQLGLDPDKPCFVAGSVRTTEDEQVIRAYRAALNVVPDLQMIIAPRHPERFSRVEDLLFGFDLPFNKRSLGVPDSVKPVLLWDTVGELSTAYSVANFSFVGGSLVNVGGHNPFEPAAYKVPVLMGPSIQNVREMAEKLIAAGGMIVVKDVEDLAQRLVEFAQRPDQTFARGVRAFTVWQEVSRAVDVVYPAIVGLIPPLIEASSSEDSLGGR